jgi:hypothetical protein
MRKRLVTSRVPSRHEADWLDIQAIAAVELTSEDDACPIEGALALEGGPGWRASGSGAQTIRIVFDQPQHIGRINLVFYESETKRTQEFVLRWSPGNEKGFCEIVRQQWNFSPPQTEREVEDYSVDLANVHALELVIVPDIGGGPARASLESMRLAQR